jgi:transglutaminase-like putative cysteine protease
MVARAYCSLDGPRPGQRVSLSGALEPVWRQRPVLGGLLSVLLLAARADATPILHEPIPPDTRDDLLLGVVLDGNLPAAVETPSGIVAAPDPRRALGQDETRLGRFATLQGHRFDTAGASTYVPDTDTRRPDTLPYDDPFTPSTAPFKRVVAFDAVDSSYRLYVRDPALNPLGVNEAIRADGTEEQFFADLVVSPSSGHRVRIPSVGPGARVVHARLGSGPTDLDFKLLQDGAENWFIEANEAGRLVVELTIPRAAFGGEFGDPHQSDLHAEAPPPNVLRDANHVAATIGVDRTSPRDTVKSLVAYFRSFTDSNERPTGKGNAYLDLALSRKGVCRHRAYAFMITALALGIPARMVMNEAHAWVEVYDGSLWRRIDLGGAGRTLGDSNGAVGVPYAAPPDPFAWPPNAERGGDLTRHATLGSTGARSSGAESAEMASGAVPPPASTTNEAPGAASASPPAPSVPVPSVARTAAPAVTLEVVEADARRSAAIHVRGQVRAGSDACPHVLVRILLRAATAGRTVSLGSLATDETGAFSGALVVPAGAGLGDYEVVGDTPGGPACTVP